LSFAWFAGDPETIAEAEAALAAATLAEVKLGGDPEAIAAAESAFAAATLAVAKLGGDPEAIAAAEAALAAATLSEVKLGGDPEAIAAAEAALAAATLAVAKLSGDPAAIAAAEDALAKAKSTVAKLCDGTTLGKNKRPSETIRLDPLKLALQGYQDSVSTKKRPGKLKTSKKDLASQSPPLRGRLRPDASLQKWKQPPDIQPNVKAKIMTPLEKAQKDAKRATKLVYHQKLGKMPIHEQHRLHAQAAVVAGCDHRLHFDPIKVEERQKERRSAFHSLPLGACALTSASERVANLKELEVGNRVPDDPRASLTGWASPRKKSAAEQAAIGGRPSTAPSSALTRSRTAPISEAVTSLSSLYNKVQPQESLARPLPTLMDTTLGARKRHGPDGADVLQMLKDGRLPQQVLDVLVSPESLRKQKDASDCPLKGPKRFRPGSVISMG